ncbi:1372_t:CDS:2 [Funneliformis mosseae]|uniref:1372_t:CDS:1 n=1 Tax=Funneliformis mosseae TaxID=27381 RepID=A0A9N9EV91_FUNMO|nr:1372_t:CDS:2 [Funneliformis mosseae]
MALRWCTYFNKVNSENYQFLSYYEYRAKQRDFSFIFEIEARSLKRDLEKLVIYGSRDMKKSATRMKKCFKGDTYAMSSYGLRLCCVEVVAINTTKGDTYAMSSYGLRLCCNHRKNFKDVGAFWERIEIRKEMSETLRSTEINVVRSVMCNSIDTCESLVTSERASFENINNIYHKNHSKGNEEGQDVRRSDEDVNKQMSSRKRGVNFEEIPITQTKKVKLNFEEWTCEDVIEFIKSKKNVTHFSDDQITRIENKMKEQEVDGPAFISLDQETLSRRHGLFEFTYGLSVGIMRLIRDLVKDIDVNSSE